MTTIAAICIFLLLCVAQVFAWAISVRLGTRWAKTPSSWSGVIWLAILVFSVQALCKLVMVLSLDYSETVQIGLIPIGLLVSFCFPLLAIKKAFSTTSIQTLKIWSATFLSFVVSFISALGIQHYFIEAFVIPSNSMAPTLIGTSVLGTCPDCGANTYLSNVAFENRRRAAFGGSDSLYVICDNFHTTELNWDAVPTDVKRSRKDRLLASKLIKPRRWDLLVFKNPRDLAQNYVKRVVGFPNETLQLKDGGVWIDGERLTPPPHLKNIQYSTEFPFGPAMNGVTPVQLGPDEYFVLGDNTMNSLDSRLWRSSAPGHAAYAVPEEYVIGVATHIYWPKNRIRILR